MREVEISESSEIPIWASPNRTLVRLQNGARINIKVICFDKRQAPLMDGYSCAFDEVIALQSGNELARGDSFTADQP